MRVFAKENFKEVRMKKGYGLVKLSELIGISKQGLAQVENRTNGISPERARLVLDILEVEFDEIFELVERG